MTICRQRPEKGPIKLMMGWISDITRAIFHVKQALCCAITETPGKGNSIQYLERVDLVPDCDLELKIQSQLYSHM